MGLLIILTVIITALIIALGAHVFTIGTKYWARVVILYNRMLHLEDRERFYKERDNEYFSDFKILKDRVAGLDKRIQQLAEQVDTKEDRRPAPVPKVTTEGDV